jgi:hypothetical protein
VAERESELIYQLTGVQRAGSGARNEQGRPRCRTALRSGRANYGGWRVADGELIYKWATTHRRRMQRELTVQEPARPNPIAEPSNMC